jgi:hypothetical protein
VRLALYVPVAKLGIRVALHWTGTSTASIFDEPVFTCSLTTTRIPSNALAQSAMRMQGTSIAIPIPLPRSANMLPRKSPNSSTTLKETRRIHPSPSQPLTSDFCPPLSPSLPNHTKPAPHHTSARQAHLHHVNLTAQYPSPSRFASPAGQAREQQVCLTRWGYPGWAVMNASWVEEGGWKGYIDVSYACSLTTSPVPSILLDVTTTTTILLLHYRTL